MMLNIVGSVVSSVSGEHMVELRLSEGSIVQVETLFKFRSRSGGAVTLDGQNGEGLPTLIRHLTGVSIAEACVDEESGALLIQFDNGSRIFVPSDPDYEAWMVTAADRSIAVAIPGGGAAFWDPPTEL
ncbi:DUF6188 family protein [Luteimicrobium xylanilyticum]|uniref:DUF6188 family protein n=1 Tax=Luteimicrobium xylanilyticum TaxID=1133546 RepID=UPI001D1488BB